MKNTTLITLISLAALITAACGGDYRQRAQGLPSEVYVLMDSSRYEGPLEQALRDVYGEYMLTMPRPEPRYDLKFVGLRTQADLERAQKHRNLLIVATIDEESNVGAYLRSLLSEEVQQRVREGGLYEIPLQDRWYRDQWILIQTADTPEALERRIRNNAGAHLRSLHAAELNRWTEEVYRRGEIKDLADSLFTHRGFSFRIQHDYFPGVDTTDFISVRRYLEDNDRWIWVWHKDDVDDLDFVTNRWINSTRDSLLQIYIRGSREDAFVRTDYRQEYQTELLEINGSQAYESRGVWVMSDFSMGGPYLNYVFHSPEQRRLYMMEFAQFSPRYRQRRFLYQFEAMARTFRANPEFDPSAVDTLRQD
ncbi:MAG: hypothetical protein HLUCCA01_01400 [Bacteroidetes bacterium HLUCCA01]|nr:MAG: hypothetical protein HLUCCA01_01400 [Bacteroidetes bacterium HLUCCA01]